MKKMMIDCKDETWDLVKIWKIKFKLDDLNQAVIQMIETAAMIQKVKT